MALAIFTHKNLLLGWLVGSLCHSSPGKNINLVLSVMSIQPLEDSNETGVNGFKCCSHGWFVNQPASGRVDPADYETVASPPEGTGWVVEVGCPLPSPGLSVLPCKPRDTAVVAKTGLGGLMTLRGAVEDREKGIRDRCVYL